MKIVTVMGLAALIMIPQLSMATPHPPDERGGLQAVYDFCSKTDPTLSGAMLIRSRMLNGGQTREQIKAVLASSDYQQSYALISGELLELTAADAVSGCRALASH